ncbi:MAG: glycosyltransferase family 39 protein [Vulcanimicrobiota bacterium]
MENNIKKKDNNITHYARFIPWLIVIAFIIRLVELGSKSFFVDEGVTIYTSSYPLGKILPLMMKMGEVHPPLYFWCIHLWKAGYGTFQFLSLEAYMRLSSVIFGVLSVYFTWLLGKKLFTRQTAFTATFLITISTFHVFYSQELRMYAPLLFLFCLSLYLFLKLLEKPGYLICSLLVVSQALAFHIHYFGLFIPAIEIMFLGYLFLLNHFKKNKEDKRNINEGELCVTFQKLVQDLSLLMNRLKWVLASLGLSLMIFSWWVPFLLKQTGHQDLGLRKNPDLLMILELFSRLSYGEQVTQPEFFGINLFLLLSIIPIALVIYTLFLKPLAGQFLIILWLFTPLTIILIAGLTHFHMFEYMYFYIVTPALWLLISSGLSKMKMKYVASLLLILIMVMNMFTFNNYQNSSYYQPQNWRRVAEYVSDKLEPGEMVIIHPSMMAMPFSVYFKNNRRIMPMDKPDLNRLKPQMYGSRGIWVVSTLNHPAVTKYKLLHFLSSYYKPSKAYITSSYNPADILVAIYFDFTRQDKNKQNRTIKQQFHN